MIGLILAMIVGFLLGVLLVIFLVAGREEEELLNRVEKTERAGEGTTQGSNSEQEPVTNSRGKDNATGHV